MGSNNMMPIGRIIVFFLLVSEKIIRATSSCRCGNFQTVSTDPVVGCQTVSPDPVVGCQTVSPDLGVGHQIKCVAKQFENLMSLNENCEYFH